MKEAVDEGGDGRRKAVEERKEMRYKGEDFRDFGRGENSWGRKFFSEERK